METTERIDMFEVPGARLRELWEYERLAKDCERFLKDVLPFFGAAQANSTRAEAEVLLRRFDEVA